MRRPNEQGVSKGGMQSHFGMRKLYNKAQKQKPSRAGTTLPNILPKHVAKSSPGPLLSVIVRYVRYVRYCPLKSGRSGNQSGAFLLPHRRFMT